MGDLAFPCPEGDLRGPRPRASKSRSHGWQRQDSYPAYSRAILAATQKGFWEPTKSEKVVLRDLSQGNSVLPCAVPCKINLRRPLHAGSRLEAGKGETPADVSASDLG
jgi:hypothetical protein